jgi:hypothetical protein
VQDELTAAYGTSGSVGLNDKKIALAIRALEAVTGRLCVSSSGLDPFVVMNLGSSVLAELRAWGGSRRDGPAS